MTAAAGLALMIVGAVLRYAVTWRFAWVDLPVLGNILIAGGCAGLVLGLVLARGRRRVALAAERARDSAAWSAAGSDAYPPEPYYRDQYPPR
ncbi:hypothetical protein [Streptomyces sp. SPB074]|uniref:hypothetical protein n=1 Tax=Streptomyces sp. (strain SPB074) TaxID=465543 RepID=UPI00017F25F5|nr:hypothetical protein [Streptomyces sp. SPB074]EDY44950.1 hypothetical protein SSBG_02965 [Streptomyces sp. SPB074]